MATKEAHNRANIKYASARYDKITVTIPKGERERWKEQAASHGMGLAEYIRYLVKADWAQDLSEKDF